MTSKQTSDGKKSPTISQEAKLNCELKCLEIIILKISSMIMKSI